jgi:L-amino acid N-acyltransferase YncA
MTMSIRPATQADAAAIAAIYGAWVRDGYATFETTPPDAAEFGRRMLSPPRLPWLVAESVAAGSGPVQSGATVLGFAYAARHRERAAYRWSADVSVYLAADACGRGIGRALYGELLPIVASLGYVSAFAGIALPNPASVRLHESMGFEPVGVYRDVGFKLGAWRDVGWWQRRLQDPPPAEPLEPRQWTGGTP